MRETYSKVDISVAAQSPYPFHKSKGRSEEAKKKKKKKNQQKYIRSMNEVKNLEQQVSDEVERLRHDIARIGTVVDGRDIVVKYGQLFDDEEVQQKYEGEEKNRASGQNFF